ncbi:MAG: hypothetical protein WBD02_10875 [Acidimicrobiia bacterium]
MTRPPVGLGGALITMVDPHRGHEVAYNRWYERDHFYAGCMIGAHCFAGARYVATRACKERRFPDDTTWAAGNAGIDAGSYLAMYWVEDGHFEDWLKWGTEQVNWLHANDRMFEARDHISTLVYRHRASASPTDMPIELALDRGYDGCFLVVHELADGQSARAVSEHYTRSGGLPGCDATAVFTPVPLLDTAPKDVPQDDASAPTRVVVVGFVDGPPLEVWDRTMVGYGDHIPTGSVGRVGWAGPFLRTIPGTDTYSNQLW